MAFYNVSTGEYLQPEPQTTTHEKEYQQQKTRIAELEQAILNALPALDDLQGEWLAVAEPYAPQQVIDIREVSDALREALKG